MGVSPGRFGAVRPRPGREFDQLVPVAEVGAGPGEHVVLLAEQQDLMLPAHLVDHVEQQGGAVAIGMDRRVVDD